MSKQEDCLVGVTKLKTNIERCKDYMRKQELIGVKTFGFEMKPETDEVIITKYYENSDDFRIIEIPLFVTGFEIKCDRDGFIEESIFSYVKQSLKVINRNKKYNRHEWFIL